MKVVVVLLAGLLILALSFIFRIGLKRLLSRYPRWNIRANFLTAFEFIIWLSYVYWATDHLFREKFYFQYLIFAIIFIVAGFLSWFLLSDIIAGVVFKSKHNFKRGSFISTGPFKGKVIAQNITFIKLKTEDGQLLRIPYSKINQSVISEMPHTEASRKHILNLQISHEINKKEAESLIRLAIINSPWSNLKEEPAINFIKDDEESHQFEVMLFSTNLKHMKFIEIELEKIPGARIIN